MLISTSEFVLPSVFPLLFIVFSSEVSLSLFNIFVFHSMLIIINSLNKHITKTSNIFLKNLCDNLLEQILGGGGGGRR